MNDAQFHYDLVVVLTLILTIMVVISVTLASIAYSLRWKR